MRQDGVNVDRFAFNRSVVGKDFQPVDEFDNAVGLIPDQVCQAVIFQGLICFPTIGRRRGCRQWGF